MTTRKHSCSGSNRISTHILTKRMTSFPINNITLFEYFNSHPHEEDDTWLRKRELLQNHFNSHPHEEDDSSRLSRNCSQKHFNSHPHEEDDITSCLLSLSKSISTHILTKRMTPQFTDVVALSDISTHILTKRMTQTFTFMLWRIIFQLTSSRRGWPLQI